MFKADSLIKSKKYENRYFHFMCSVCMLKQVDTTKAKEKKEKNKSNGTNDFENDDSF